MSKTPFVAGLRLPRALGLIVLLALGLPACASAGDRHDKLRKDAYTCESFGARHGTRAYSDCMLEQQRRRDDKQLRSLSEAQMASQMALEGQIMADRARKQRCDRNPDRKECRRR